VQMVVSSSLTRAIDTADIVFPPAACAPGAPRILLDTFREVQPAKGMSSDMSTHTW
jgi:hypothetical protein